MSNLNAVEFYIANWVRWLKNSDLKLGYAATRFLQKSGSTSFDDMIDSLDVEAAKIFDSIVYDLPEVLRKAIEKQWLGVRWDLEQKEIDRLYEVAVDLVSQKLNEKNLF